MSRTLSRPNTRHPSAHSLLQVTFWGDFHFGEAACLNPKYLDLLSPQCYLLVYLLPVICFTRNAHLREAGNPPWRSQNPSTSSSRRVSTAGSGRRRMVPAASIVLARDRWAAGRRVTAPQRVLGARTVMRAVTTVRIGNSVPETPPAARPGRAAGSSLLE